MSKPRTSYNQNSSTSSITLADATVTLGSTTYRLNGFTTATAPIQWWDKPLTAFTNVAKNATAFVSNSLNETGVRANSTSVQANSTTVKATGYTDSVPAYESARPLTAWAEA